MKTYWVIAAAFTVLSSIALAAPSHNHAKAAPKKTVLICPVTGDKIKSAKSAAGHSMYKGKTYYFCCAGCKPRFDKRPVTFVKNAAAGKFEKI